MGDLIVFDPQLVDDGRFEQPRERGHGPVFLFRERKQRVSCLENISHTPAQRPHAILEAPVLPEEGVEARRRRLLFHAPEHTHLAVPLL